MKTRKVKGGRMRGFGRGGEGKRGEGTRTEDEERTGMKGIKVRERIEREND